MPLLRRQPFQRKAPSSDLRPDDEVFLCEATKEVFRDYDEFFQRTILCNSLVWSCSVTGKANLTYEEAVECEKKARKRLGAIPRPLKRGLVWLAGRTRRGRLAELVDDVYVYAYNRFFVGEVVEAVIKEQWCDCRILKVIPPTEEEVAKDAQEEAEEMEKERKEAEEAGKSPPKSKDKKTFSPPDHLFRYEVEEVEPDDPEVNEVHTIEAEDVRREKGTYTREKNLLFLKNLVELDKEGNFRIKKDVREKNRLDEVKFTDVFAGPEPKFEESKRLKGMGSQSSLHTAKKKLEDKKKESSSSSSSKGRKKVGKNQGTLDGWVKGEKPTSNGASSSSKPKKQTAAEIEAEMKRIREQNARFKEEMKQRAEEARKKRLEDKAREKERKKEEKKLLSELMSEWNKLRDDLECDDLRELPVPAPVHCRIPNKLFGDFLVLLEFCRNFGEMLEVENSFPQEGVTFELLEEALVDSTTIAGSKLFDVLQFMLGALLDLQEEEDEEVKLDKLTVDAANIDKNILGKDEDVANQIRSATAMSQWPTRTQGQKLRDLHMDEWSITEILRLHLAAAGAFRSEKLIMWLYQQRGGYRLSDDPGLNFRMEEPQILEALTTKTVFELGVGDKIKILHCLMYQILSFASVRDVIDERFGELSEAKSNLRNHQIAENRRQKQMEEAEKQKRREERMQKKEEDLKAQEKTTGDKKDEDGEKKEEKQQQPKKKEEVLPDAHLTERQRLAIQAQKEKEEKKKQREEEIKREEAAEQQEDILDQIAELQKSCGITFLGRDRAYRRFWVLETLPGLFVEHDDDTVGPCLPEPTRVDPNAGPMDEAAAMKKVAEIMEEREKAAKAAAKTDEKSSSDKENDESTKVMEVNKTYSKKAAAAPASSTAPSSSATAGGASVLKQKVLSAKNGTLDVQNAPGPSEVKTEVKLEPLTNGEVSSANQQEDDDADKKDQKSTVALLPWGACLSHPVNCPVHSSILPKTHWSYFSTEQQLDDLIAALNVRGFRENELRDKLVQEKEKISKNLKKFDLEDKLNQEEVKVKEEGAEAPRDEECSIGAVADLTLRDQILELEEKIFLGTLGTLKVRDRDAWTRAIQERSYDRQCDSLAWGGRSVQDTPFESRLQSAGPASRAGSPEPQNKRDSTGSNASSVVAERRRKVRDLSSAILQVAQMVDEKFFKPPLGEDEKEKKKRLREEEKRKKEREDRDQQEEGADDDVQEVATKILTPLENWEKSLMSCTSHAQLFIHLTTLENSITWSKSLLNTRCRICRRKTDPESMLLCDGCDRGHHTYCLKPKLKSIPEGDWYCSECKPKKRVVSPKKKTRRMFSTEEEEEDKHEEREEEVEDGGDDDGGSEEEEEEEEEVDGGVEEEDDDDRDEEMDVDDDNQDGEHDSDAPTVDDDDVPLKRAKKKRTVELPKKKKASSSSSMVNGQDKKKSGPVISQLLGKRRCAAEANERIARVAHEQANNSGNSSGAEEAAAAAASSSSSRGTRHSSRAATKRSLDSDLRLAVAVASAAAESNSSSARSKRRRAVDDKIEGMFNPTVLEDLLNAMMKHRDGWPFDRPITKTEAPDYHQIIKRPMDLGTIRSNIIRMKYNCNQEVVDDIELVFQNCRTYNREDAEEAQCGARLEKYFKKEARKLNLLEQENAEPQQHQHASKKARRTF